MKILIGCPLAEEVLPELRALTTELVYEPELTAERLEELIPDVAVLVVCRLRVSPELIEAGKALQLVVRAGTDTSNIAIEAASAAGVFVANCPYKDAIAIAELTIGLLVALDRRLVENVESLREHIRADTLKVDALGLAGRKLGTLGFGPVEREIVKRARAFEMHVLASSPKLTPELAAEHHVEFCAWPRELARESDAVTVYAAAQDADKVLVDAEFLRNMRAGASFVYVGHPAALDQAALLAVARERGLRVACDISAPQLPGSDTGRITSRLQALPGGIGTCRLADRTQQVRDATSKEVVRIIREFLIAGEVVNCLNLSEHSPATWQLVLRLRDEPGVLAAIVEVVRADGINIEDITSRLFTGARAVWCKIALDERPSNDALSAIRLTTGVLHLDVRALV
jgi:D-3-phosphoglycerate dehydrogenase